MARFVRFPHLLLAAAVALAAVAFAGTAFALITTLTVDDRGTLINGDTAAVISGTIQCTPGDTVSVNVTVSQPHGQFIANGYGQASLLCDGSLQNWQVTVTSYIGWKPGPATVLVNAYQNLPCPIFPCPPPPQPVQTGDTIHLGR